MKTAINRKNKNLGYQKNEKKDTVELDYKITECNDNTIILFKLFQVKINQLTIFCFKCIYNCQ